MIRITTLLWIALLAVAGGTVMNVSYEVRHVQKHLTDLARDAQKEQDYIGLFKAERDALNDPKAIDDLAQRYLPALQPTPIQRFVALEDIPLRPSAEQAGGMEQSNKPVKDSPARKKAPVVAKPAGPARSVEVASRGAARAPAGPAVGDGVGLILARIERRQ